MRVKVLTLDMMAIKSGVVYLIQGYLQESVGAGNWLVAVYVREKWLQLPTELGAEKVRIENPDAPPRRF